MDDEVAIRVRLQGLQQFVTDEKRAAGAVEDVGRAATRSAAVTAAAARTMSGALSVAGKASDKVLGAVWTGTKRGAFGLGLLGAAGTQWGLSFNAQMESAQLRFQLFTKNADEARKVLKGVQAVDVTSQFNLADLSDATAMLGNNGREVAKLPRDLRGIANAAAASGKGLPALQGISIALSQIAAKGRLSQEEINQLNEAGAPGAQKIIQKEFGLTAKQVGNLGGQQLSATRALDALTRAWTSGKMAKAAERQTKTLGGQWSLLTGNLQKSAGAVTKPLADSLQKDVLPAANRASQAITDIFGRKGLSNEEKLRQARAVIEKELGPIAQDAVQWIDAMHLDKRIGDAIRSAMPAITEAAAHVGEEGAKAFVSAWLHSGPEAQVLVALILGKKLGAGKLIGKGLDVLGGKRGGGAGGGLLGGLTGRGGSPANPLYVFDVSQTAPGRNLLGKVSKVGFGALTATGAFATADAAVLAARAAAAKRAGVNTRARPTGSFVSDVPSNLALADTVLGALGLGHPFAPHPAAPAHVSDPAVIHGLATGPFPLEATLKLYLGDKQVAQSTAQVNAKRKARRAGR